MSDGITVTNRSGDDTPEKVIKNLLKANTLLRDKIRELEKKTKLAEDFGMVFGILKSSDCPKGKMAFNVKKGSELWRLEQELTKRIVLEAEREKLKPVDDTRYNYDDLMKELKSYEEIVEEPPLLPSEPRLCWGGLLRNHPNAADFFYDRSHGALSIRVRPAPSNFSASLMIHSIDDGSIVLLGPAESLEKAEKRALLLKAEVEEWGGWIPTAEQVTTTAEKTGCYWNR